MQDPSLLRRSFWLWIAFLIFQFILLAVGWTLADGSGAAFEDPDTATFVTYVFAFLAFSDLLLAFNIHRLTGGRPTRSQVSESPAPVPESGQTAFIIRLALLEFVGLLGFVLVLLTGDFTAMLPFSIAAIAALLLSRPSEKLLISG